MEQEKADEGLRRALGGALELVESSTRAQLYSLRVLLYSIRVLLYSIRLRAVQGLGQGKDTRAQDFKMF